MTVTSRAAVRRLAAELADRTPTGLNDERTKRVEQYRPQGVDPDVWATIRVTHQRAMQFGADLTDSGFAQVMSIVAHYLTWRHSRRLDTSLEASFTLDAIDAYCELGIVDLEPVTRSTYRSRLMPIADAIDPHSIPRPVFTSGGHQPIKSCYSRAEEAAIRRVAERQPRKITRRKMCAVVGLAAGAGLDTVDMRHLQVDHIDVTDNGIGVHVPGSRPRFTVVRRDYEHLVVEGIHGLTRHQLLFGTHVGRRNVLGNTFDDASLFDDTPRIEVSRLRSTWLASLMEARVPVQVILNAAGLKSARALIDLLPHLRQTQDADVVTMLRGVAS